MKTKTGSYGLNNIKERVAGIGGTVKIISFKGARYKCRNQGPLMEGGIDKDDKSFISR